MATTFYGSDTSCIDDVGLVDVQVTNPKILIGQRLARLLQTPTGALGAINDDPNAGFDVRQFINAKLSPSALGVAQSKIKACCERDEQVYQATVRMVLGSGGALSIGILVQSSAGPFTLTLNVDKLTSSLVFSFT